MSFRDLFPASGDPASDGERRWHRLGLGLLVAYFAAGVGYSLMLAPVVRYPDEGEYLALSHNLLHGPGYSMDGVHLTASRPPGYAFFIAGIEAMGGGFFGIRVAQFLLMVGTIGLLWRLCGGRKLFAGMAIVTGLVICYPVLFYTGGTLYPQTLSAFLFVLALNFVVAAREGWRPCLAAGLVFGLLILEVPTFLFTLGVVAGVAAGLGLMQWRNGAAMVVAAFLVVGTWTARNEIEFHRFVPVASNSGLNFLMGNNPGAMPEEAAANAGMKPYYDESRRLNLDEFAADQFYRESAVQWMEAHPVRAAELYLEKVLNFFNIVNVYAAGNKAEISWWKQAVMAVSYVALMGLLIWRLCEQGAFPLIPLEKLLLAVYVLTAFTSAIFFTRIRHRLPFDYLIIALVAMQVSRHLERWIKGKAGPAGSPSSSGLSEAAKERYTR